MSDAPDRRPHAPATTVVAAGRPARTPGAPIVAPVVMSSTYVAGGDVVYGRAGNPTWTAFEDALGALEGGDALVFASGMAAVTAGLSLVPHGGAVVTAEGVYNGTVSSLLEREQAGAVEVRRVDLADTAATVAALDGAAMLWLENPSNPLLEVCDVAALARAARERGVLSVCDNTFATPLLQRPLDLGADVVVHSVTKYLSGHGDLLLGATVTRPDEPGRALLERLRTQRVLGGAIAGPQEVWLALRGLRTLDLRLERSGRNAAELARRLTTHPEVERVRFPGWGSMISIEVPGGADRADRVAASTELWIDSTSLGGVESQIERRRRIPTEPVVVPENLLRLSVGIEDVEDLWDDLDQALHRP